MSSINSDIRFTPFHSRHQRDSFNQSNIFSNSNINNQFINRISNNNINQSNFNNYNENLNEMNNLNAPSYILITKFDNDTKEILFNFIGQEKYISSRDINIVGNDKIIIQFQNQHFINEFINDYNKVKDSFYGTQIKLINKTEKERIINNNINRAMHNISYNSYMSNNNTNMVQLPQNKSNFQKFLDVFLNL